MCVLDPETVARTPPTGSFPAHKVPFLKQHHVDLGYLPNRDRLKPGDLILTEPVRPTCSSRLIQAAQRRQTERGSQWTHAAIYVGQWTIIEANPFKGIHKSVLFDFVPNFRIKFRRLKCIAQLDDLTAERMGLRIALDAALRMPNSSYKFAAAVQIARDALAFPIARFNISQNLFRHRHHICSSLFEDCVLRQTGEQLRSADHIESSLNMSPAMLNNCDAMIDIDVGWAKIVQS